MTRLNPWIIEVNNQEYRGDIDVRLANRNTGAIMFIPLSVDDIASINTVGIECITALATAIGDNPEILTDIGKLIADKLIQKNSNAKGGI